MNEPNPSPELPQALCRAKSLLSASPALTCAVCTEHETFTSTLRGIAPLLRWQEEGADFSGGCAADRVVGKAAALLFAALRVRCVHAPVMSRAALAVFSRCGIDAYCDTVAPYIVNRAKTGLCPMEQAVAQVETPEQAVPVLREALAARMRETP